MRCLALLCALEAFAMALPASAGQSNSGILGSIFGSSGDLLGNISGSVGPRLLDLVDCIELNGGVGPGFKLGLEFIVVRIGVGSVRSTRGGIDSRQTGVWSERDAMMGLAPFSLLLAPCELMRGRGETWDGLANAFEMLSLGVERMERDNLRTSTILYHKATAVGGWHERPGDRYSLGGEAHLLYLGGRLRFKPCQLAAFVLGLVGIDVSQRMAHPEFSGYPQGRPR
jgi:hypothetical protein